MRVRYLPPSYKRQLISLAKRIKKIEHQLEHYKLDDRESEVASKSKVTLKQLKRRVEILEGKLRRKQTDSKPSTKNCLKFLLPEAKHWHNIGILLGISEQTLEQIESDYPSNCTECVREMIKSWLKQVEPKPTWKDLAEAVQVVSPILSKKILESVSPSARN